MNDSSNEMDAADLDGREELSMLLAGEVLESLNTAESDRLEELLLDGIDAGTSMESLQRIASSIALAAELGRQDWPTIDSESQVALNPKLVEKIRRDASEYLPGLQTHNGKTRGLRDNGDVSTKTAPSAASWIGWGVAASLAFVCVGMWMAGNRDNGVTAVASLTSDEDVKAWYDAHPEAIRLNWTVNDPKLVDPKFVDQKESNSSVSDGDSSNAGFGTVAWDSKSQTGFMSFEGLPKNDAAVQQYQLWIIDPKRDDKPIDGGVFDIVDSGRSLVPIRAKLAVIEPAGFAITVEKPGGVVVSDQSRLPLLALVP